MPYKVLGMVDTFSKHVAVFITVYSESEYVSESLGEGMMVDNIQTRSHGGERIPKKIYVWRFAARSYIGQQGKEIVKKNYR
jgi:hypothetical protein